MKVSAEKKLDSRWRQNASKFERQMWDAICNGVSVETRKNRAALEAKRLAYLKSKGGTAWK